MLADNLKTLRKNKGLSQEEVAIRINVVRQTVSKWEKGLSVPDADSLIRLADLFEVSVSDLLGEEVDNDQEVNAVAEQLSRVNEQLAIKNRRWGCFIRFIIAFFLVNAILLLIPIIIGFVSFTVNKEDATIEQYENSSIYESDQVQ